MRKYKNTVTGEIIEVESEIIGGNWQPAEAAAPDPKEKKPKKGK